MLEFSGKRHQHSHVGKFTVVYNVHIYYAMATILVACVLLSLLCESTACLVIPGNDIITLLKIHFGDRVLIHYAMVTILVACVLQSLQNS